MDLKTVGVMLGGVGAVMGLAYARSRIDGSKSLAEMAGDPRPLTRGDLKAFAAEIVDPRDGTALDFQSGIDEMTRKRLREKGARTVAPLFQVLQYSADQGDYETVKELVASLGTVLENDLQIPTRLSASSMSLAEVSGDGRPATKGDLQGLVEAIKVRDQRVLDRLDSIEGKMRRDLVEKGSRKIAPTFEILRQNLEEGRYEPVRESVKFVGQNLEEMGIPTRF